eukprot:1186476-Prorocentrum_minimum.AAC.1
MAIRERSTRSGTCEMSWPAKRMVPCAHGTCRERMPTLLSELPRTTPNSASVSVLLPAPVRPHTPTLFPGGIRSEKSDTAGRGTFGYCTVTCERERER